ncbi:MAG: hypothetical protein ACJ77C_11540 [Chloroflexota bacterium]
MGPNNPWSPQWRPDPTGRRLASIRTARRGALLAAVAYVPLAAAAIATTELPRGLALLLVLVIGSPGVALLGAGLAPAAIGSKVDAVAVGVAFALGCPVAAVTSVVIGAFVLGSFIPGEPDLASQVLLAGVRAALGIAPLVALIAGGWVFAVRRLERSRGGRPPTAASV